MTVMIGLLFMSGGAYAETLTCAGATLSVGRAATAAR
jgi:hypothetical protein